MFPKKKKEEEKDSFRWSEQSSFTDNRQQYFASGINHFNRKKYINDSNGVKTVLKMDTKGVCT